MPIVTGVPWPTAVTVAGSPAPAGSSPSICTSAGIPPGQEVDATRNLRWVSTRRWTSSKPSVSTSHFMRARSLLSRLPAWSNTLKQASMVGSNSSRGVKSSRARAGCGVVPSPPAMNTRKPRSTVPSSVWRATPITPTSLNMAWPQSVSQPEKLILNLRGSRWLIGLRTKCRYVASAQGVTSSSSWGQAPARWHPCTLRTVSPQASRVVSPAAAR